uniref:DUF1156 domain-containing protein n=1 Tax=Cyanothece sp. (strain PCC 7425 / ATCC 29141) TaxID=395961 RepID=B8HUC1_CYAP4
MTYRKKLIEVALPLEAINMESAREKSIRHGHPSTLHLWWARRPLAACRAVLWASLVDDPSSWPDKFPTEEEQQRERQRLFDILGRIAIETDKKGNQKQVVRGLVSWDEVNDPKSKVLEAAQREIARCLAWDRNEEPPTKPDAVREYIAKYAPPVYDPFAGGGSIPLEAQRLGLEAHASDLNPVAVLINKALIEIPPKFKDQPPINPEDRKQIRTWKGAQGLAADIHFYGTWMRDEAFKRIGHLYPKVKLPKEYGGGEATVIAWLWSRTVKCPNPACGCDMPLMRSLALSTKTGKETWVEPIIDRSQAVPTVQFEVKSGKGKIPEGTVSRKGAVCIVCTSPVSLDYVRAEGKAGQMGTKMTAIVIESNSGRTYISADEVHEKIAVSANAGWSPDEPVTTPSHDVDRLPMYGMYTWGDAFSSRQLTTLTTLCELISTAHKVVQANAIDTGLAKEIAILYSDAVVTYLGLCLSKLTDYNSTFVTWSQSRDQAAHVFTKQSLQMVWDYAEVNPFAKAAGDFLVSLKGIGETLEKNSPASKTGYVRQFNAMNIKEQNDKIVISTDPPYFDNVGYSDLSDYFYVWLRRSLCEVYKDLFVTLLTPKNEELIAASHRFNGSRKKAQQFFEEGLRKVFIGMRETVHSDYPLAVYYAFKQTEKDNTEGKSNSAAISSTGWETMLEGLIQANFTITGTLPVRTERSTRSISIGTNSLASSIVLVCRPRPADSPKITRRQFLSELKRELPNAIKTLQQGNVAPVDLAQASIGPGMAVFSKYAAVLENDGSPMRVRTALQLINQILDEFLTEQEGEFDSDSRWALTWFEQYQFEPGQYGDAETLSKAKNTSVQGMVEAGILEAKGGKVRLLKREELQANWNPESDDRIPDWEITQRLIYELDQKGETGAAELLAKLDGRGEVARDLAYRLYSLCDRKGWAQEAIAYNSLVISWPEITRLGSELKAPDSVQTSFL